MARRRNALIIVAWSLLVVCGLATGLVFHRLWIFRSHLERLADRLSLDTGPESTLIYDGSNNLVSALFEEHRIAVRLEEMSPHVINAVLATEDKRFFDHDGVDIRRIIAAFAANTKAGEIVQGGSTITQQLVRSVLLDRERTYSRKIKEAILARRLEERYSKRAILEAYLNRIYFGDGYYGVEAAAVGYFGKSARDLDAAESATLAGLIKGPSVYLPTKAPDKARERRDWVLGEMRAEGMLSDQEVQAAVSVPVTTLLARGEKSGVQDLRHARGSEYFRDAVVKELLEHFDSEAVYTGGLRVYTTLDLRLQRIAENVIAGRLKGVPRGGTDPLQGALVAIDPRTGYVRAIVGGRSYQESQFNRALEARRQPGSAFKPFIYAMALESGFSPGSRIEGLDQPIPTRQGPWLPDGEHESVSVSLRDALVRSSNRAAAHLLQQVGVQRTLDFVQRFGIRSPMPAVPSIALGTGELTLFELTSAYGVFASQGVWRSPILIRRVVDRYGRELYSAPRAEHRVISEATTYLMNSMMSDVVDHGTATTARAQGFRLHAAGKTGTSQEYTDAWFVGFTPTLVAGVWFGYDKPRPIMNRGFASVVAVPAWARFMISAMKGAENEWYEMPGSLVKVKICRLSGLLATDRCHLPVHGYAPHGSATGDAVTASASTVQTGGVFEDIRAHDRVPPPCNLPHSDSAPTDALPDPYQTTPAYETYPPPSRATSVMPALPPVQAMEHQPVPEPARPVTLPPPFMMPKPAPAVITSPAALPRPAKSEVISVPPATAEPPAPPATAPPAAAPPVTAPPPAETKPETAKPGSSKPEETTAPKPEEKPAPKPEEKPEPKPEEKPAPKPEEKPAPKPEESEIENPLIPGAKVKKEAPPPPPSTPPASPDAPIVPGAKPKPIKPPGGLR